MKSNYCNNKVQINNNGEQEIRGDWQVLQEKPGTSAKVSHLFAFHVWHIQSWKVVLMMMSLALRRPRFGGLALATLAIFAQRHHRHCNFTCKRLKYETLRWLWGYDPSIDPLHPKGGLQVFKVSREAKRFHVFGWFLWRVVAAISVACSFNWYGATLEPHHRALEMQKGFRQLNRIPFTRCCLPLLPLQSSNERPPSTTKLGSVSFVRSHGQLTFKLDRVPWHHKVIDWSMIQLSIWSKTIIFQAPIASQLEHATSWCPAWYAILSNCYLLSSVNLLLLDIMSIGFSSQDIGM